MPQDTETVTGTPEATQQNSEIEKETVDASENGEQVAQERSHNDSQPSVQEDSCILKVNAEQAKAETEASASSVPVLTPKSPVQEATEDFLLNEKEAYYSEDTPVPEPRTPANSEASEGPSVPTSEEPTTPQVIGVYETVVLHTPSSVEEASSPITLNGHTSAEEPLTAIHAEPQAPLTNGQTNGECKFEPRKISEPQPEVETIIDNDKPQVLNGTIANELVTEDYKLPDVVEVKKNFEYVQPAGQNIGHAPPKKGTLSTTLDFQSLKQAYQDVRHDGSDTQWAVFKFEGPRIVTSATGADFAQFKTQFGDDERAFAYIRIQTGDELSRRAKFLLVTWVGPSVSVLKRAKMSTDKALIKDIVSNFAVELQTENISDINLQNFETELDKASGAHYGTGVRS